MQNDCTLLPGLDKESVGYIKHLLSSAPREKIVSYSLMTVRIRDRLYVYSRSFEQLNHP